MHFTVYNRFYRHPVRTDDDAKAAAAAGLRAFATETDSFVAVHRQDNVVKLFRVSPRGVSYR